MTLLTQEYLDEVVDLDELANTYSTMLTKDLNEKIASGELAPEKLDLSLPEGFRKRIEQFLMARQKVLNECINWFTYRVDEFGEAWVDFPVVGYRFGNPPDTALNTPSVARACKRLTTRKNILKVIVRGPVPQHWFHGPMEGY